eukprot:15475618-Alexandrium_andersonii.AAC.1
MWTLRRGRRPAPGRGAPQQRWCPPPRQRTPALGAPGHCAASAATRAASGGGTNPSNKSTP